MGNLAGMGLLRESRGGKKGKHWSPGEPGTGLCPGSEQWPRMEKDWARDNSPPPGYEGKQVWLLWFLKEGTQLGRATKIVVAGRHAGPLTSLSRKQREGSQCSSSPSLCPTASPAQNVLRGGAVAKFWIFSRNQERRGRWVGRGKRPTPKQLRGGRMVHARGKECGGGRRGVLTHPGHRGVVGSLKARA